MSIATMILLLMTVLISECAPEVAIWVGSEELGKKS